MSNSIIEGVENLQNKLDDILDKVKLPVFNTTMFMIHISYFIVYFGIASIHAKYMNYLNIFIEVFVCLFLIARFHPFREHTLHKYDSTIIFGSAILLLTNLGANQFIFNKILSLIKNFM
jgi:hypothetical protein